MLRRLSLLLLPTALLAACMPDFEALKTGSGGRLGGDAGTGGSAGDDTPDAGQATAGIGGSAGDGGSAGTGGTGGSGPAGDSCGGCARVTIPITGPDTTQSVVIQLNPHADLTGATLIVRLRAPGATGGALQIFAQDESYDGDYSFYSPLATYAEMTDIYYTLPPATDVWDTAHIVQMSVSVVAGPGSPCEEGSPSCDWVQPTVLEIDSIEVLDTPGTPPGPYTFDTSAYPLQLSTYMPIVGSRVSWIP